MVLTTVPVLGPVAPASAASVATMAFTGGEGTATVNGTLFARQGAPLTLTVTTDANTRCVEVTGAHTAMQTAADKSTSWAFSFTAGNGPNAGGDGVKTVTATAFKDVNSAGKCTKDQGETFGVQAASYTLDTTAPLVTGAIAPAPNAAGWNKSDVTITWSASDVGSGVGSGPTPATDTVTADTVGVARTANAADRLGNTSTGSVAVKLDKTAPTITASRSPAANANGWTNADVTVSFTCTDATSGIKACPSAQTVTTNGANQSAAGTAVDNADNDATTTVTGISIDKVAPSLSGAPTTGPNAAGWYNSPVAIAWTCGDALSGINGGCPANSTINSEGTGLTATASVGDKADNTTTASSSPAVKIDRTPPATRAEAAPNTDWNNVDVTVNLAASDSLSGVDTTHFILDGGAEQTGASVKISTEGVHALQFWSVDNAGNVEGRQSIQIKIDKTPPTIDHTQSPAPNASGWNNGDVTVTFTCGDVSGSGIAACTGPQTVTTEGKNQPVIGTAVDQAGNTATDPATVSIDKTAPTITGAADRAANASGWYKADVAVGFTCGDALSGVASCSASRTLGEGANQSVTGTATDAAGNSASATVGGINVDKTAPSLTGAALTGPNANGWYSGDVVVAWTCNDNLSGVDGACPASTTVTGEGSNLAATAATVDLAGNSASAAVGGIKIDRTAPSTSIEVPEPKPSGWYPGPVRVTLTTGPDLSGVATTYYSVDGGAEQVYTGPFTHGLNGTHTITFWSVDRAGNVENRAGPGHVYTINIDLTAPTIAASRAPAANSFGWVNTPVTVSFACADGESGIWECTGPTTLSREGTDWQVSGTATDKVGNTASTGISGINIDLSPPTLTGQPTDKPNTAGWYKGDVTIKWVGTDNLSGIDPATQPANSVITGEGNDLGAGPVTIGDKAGNASAQATIGEIKIDRTAPTITGQAVSDTGTPRAPNAAGWYNSAVRVRFACTDALSGVAACGSDVVMGQNGANQSAGGNAADVAGNTASTTVGGINIDSQPPQTSANNQCDGTNGFCRGQTATVVLTAADQAGLSGVKEIRYSVNGGAEQVAPGATTSITVPLAATSGVATVEFYAVDNAGNSERKGGVSINFDNITPTVSHTLTPEANADGWNNTDVKVHFDARDDDQGSGVNPASVTPDQVVNTETTTAGQVVNGQATDLAGNTGTDSVTVRLDKTAPTITAAADTTGRNENQWYRGPVAVTFACTDALSGVATCPAAVTLTSDGANLAATGTAKDRAGNTATAAAAGINIDSAAPTITGAATTKPNANGWYNGPVTVHFTCADTLSGIQECPADVTVSTAGANQTVVGTAVDKAGNVASFTVIGINIDLKAPTLSGAPSLFPNAAGWYNTDVKIDWTAADDLAGIDPGSLPANSVITGEGDNLGASAGVADLAGNAGTGSVSGIKIDRTPPTIDGAPTAAPNAAGWYRSAVTVRFTCADNLSGVASCPSDQVLTTNGANQSVTSDVARDVAQNISAGKTVGGINIDNQRPQTTAALSCLASDGFCRGQTATVVLTALDQSGLSGVREIRYRVNDGAEQVVAAASADVSIPLDGSGRATVRYYAVDKADNAETENGVSINFDNIAPTVTHTLTPEANAAGWNSRDVTVAFSAVDDTGGSGLDPNSITAPVTVSTETAEQTVTGQARDVAGNVGTDSAIVRLDKTSPTISAAATTSPNANGWYNGPVTVRFICSDALSGVATCPADVTLTRNGAGQSVSGTVIDNAGNIGSVTVSGINIDATAPAIAVNGVANNGVYTLGTIGRPSCTATDTGGAGLAAACNGSLTGGNANGTGAFTYTVTATDLAGNTTTVTTTYQVVYRWDGFLQPINDAGHPTCLNCATSVFKAASTVPVRFHLRDAGGNVVQASSPPEWLTPAMIGPTTAAVDESVYSDPETSGVAYRWEPGSQRYSYSWATARTQPSNYWRIGVKLDDGTTRVVTIGLR